MFFSIDRIVDGVAMLIGEDRKPLEVPAHMLPNGAKEGDTVRYRNGMFFPAPEKTAERRAMVADMLALLLQGDEEDEGEDEDEDDEEENENNGDDNQEHDELNGEAEQDGQ